MPTPSVYVSDQVLRRGSLGRPRNSFNPLNVKGGYEGVS